MKKLQKFKISRLKLKIFFGFFGFVLIFSLLLPIASLLSIQNELDLQNFDLNSPIRSVAGICFIATVLSILYGILFANRIVRPITELSQNALKVSTGHFDVRVKSYTKKDELSDLVTNFNLMVEQLSKNEYLHKDFISNVSHEFKTPVSSIMGYAEMLSSKTLTDDKRIEYAEVIERQANKLSKLSSNMLRLSELDNNSMLLSKSTFFIDEQIRDVLVMLQHEWEEKEIRISLDSKTISCNGDKALLYQVWVNIIANAIKFTDKKGSINISITQDDGIKVTISDTGKGMNAEQLERAFERFYKGDTSRSSKGTGLGLSIAKKVVELHDGKISVSSIEGEGTTFAVVL